MCSRSLRRRFEQNQEDCTFTVLALLPTAAENILGTLQVEAITHELQQKKAERLARGTAAPDAASTEASSGPPSVAGDDRKSLQSFQSDSYVHASQMATEDSGTVEGSSSSASSRPGKTKAQLWAELKIGCRFCLGRSFLLIAY